MNMRAKTKSKSIAVIIAVTFPLFIFFLIISLTQTPEDFRAVGGPSRDMLSTRGVFSPVGYIEFTLSPDIRSLRGYYAARIEIRPVFTEKQLQNGFSWPSIRGGDDQPHWGTRFTFTTGTIRKEAFSVKTRMDIPNDPLLSGESISFHLMYAITYPDLAAGGKFANYLKEIHQEIEVSIGDELPSETIAWVEHNRTEGAQLAARNKGLGLAVLSFIWFCAIMFLWISWKERKQEG